LSSKFLGGKNWKKIFSTDDQDHEWIVNIIQNGFLDTKRIMDKVVTSGEETFIRT
jgi:hypothetical protein